MNHFELENKLKAEQDHEPPMSELVRKRLEQTYQMVGEAATETPSVPTQPKSAWRRRTAATTAAAAVLGVCVFASGFVSPVMADSIRQIPVLGSLFSSMEVDLGLKNAANEGLTTHVNSKVSFEDVKLEVTETVFDGNRAVYALKVIAPNLKDGQYDNGLKKVKLSDAVDDIQFKIPGYDLTSSESPLNGFVQYGGAGSEHKDTLIVEQSFNTRGEATAGLIPDTFDAEVTLKLAGIDHTFTLNVPFTKSTKDVEYLKPEVTQTAGDLAFTIHNIDITPITTNLNYTLQKGTDNVLSDKEERQLMYTKIAVFDDKGNLLGLLSGNGEYKDNRLDYSGHYASAISRPQYLVLKPFVQKDGDFPDAISEDQYVQGLEVRVDLPAVK